MAIAKCLNIFHNSSFTRIANGCLDNAAYGGSNLATVRVSGDVNTGTNTQGIARTAYICFNIVPCSSTGGIPPYNAPNPDVSWMWNANFNLQLSGDYFWDQANSDMSFMNVGMGNITPLCGASDRRAHYLYAGAKPQCTLTQKGKDKINYVLQAARNLMAHGWSVAFGFTNEPNNLGGYVYQHPSGGPVFWSWWPMQPRVYASAYYTMVGEIKDRAYELDSAWDPRVGFGECAHYVSCQSDPLEDPGQPYSGVPSNPTGPDWLNVPDIRYPNLFLYWYKDGDKWPSVSPRHARDLKASFITYHLYDNVVNHFIWLQEQVLDPAQPDKFSFRHNNNRTGQAPYSDVGYAVTEWGCATLEGQQAIAFLNDVWTSPSFQALYSKNLRAAYWYCDYCFGSGAKGIFQNASDSGLTDCPLTYLGWASQSPCDPNWNPLAIPVCGWKLKEM